LWKMVNIIAKRLYAVKIFLALVREAYNITQRIDRLRKKPLCKVV